MRDERVKLLRFSAPELSRTIGLAWWHTPPRKIDFAALGQLATDVLRWGDTGAELPQHQNAGDSNAKRKAAFLIIPSTA